MLQNRRARRAHLGLDEDAEEDEADEDASGLPDDMGGLDTAAEDARAYEDEETVTTVTTMVMQDDDEAPAAPPVRVAAPRPAGKPAPTPPHGQFTARPRGAGASRGHSRGRSDGRGHKSHGRGRDHGSRGVELGRKSRGGRGRGGPHGSRGRRAGGSGT